MTYQIADGHDNEAGLTIVTPQPACEGIFYPKDIISASGDVYETGAAYCEWRFGPELLETSYAALLTQFGLTIAKTNEVTIRTMSDPARATFANYNALIIRPRAKYQNGFYRDVVFLLKRLEALP